MIEEDGAGTAREFTVDETKVDRPVTRAELFNFVSRLFEITSANRLAIRGLQAGNSQIALEQLNESRRVSKVLVDEIIEFVSRDEEAAE